MLNKKTFLLIIFFIFITMASFAQSLVVSEGSAQIKNNDLAMARDEAIENAKTNAVEKAVGSFVSRDMIASNQAVIGDLILTKSSGFISDYKVLKEEKFQLEGYPMLKVEIEAQIRQASIWTSMSNVEALYSAMGKPRFAIYCENDESQIAVTRLAEKLKSYGFLVVDNAQNKAEMLSLAKENKADILVLANIISNVAKPQRSSLPGVKDIYFAKTVFDVKFIYGNSGEYIFNLKAPINAAGKSFQGEEEAKAKSINEACNILFDKNAERFNESIINRWINELNGGQRYFLYFKNLSYDDFQKAMALVRDQRFFLDLLHANYKSNNGYVEVYFKADKPYVSNMLKDIKINKKSPSISKISDKKFSLSY